jgi:excisionase family DNA binding protein
VTEKSKLAYSIAEAAAATSLGRSKIYELIGEGRIEARKIGRRTVIPSASLAALFDEEV